MPATRFAQGRPPQRVAPIWPNLEAFSFGLWSLAALAVAARVALSPTANTVFGVFQAAGARWLAARPLYPRAGEFLYSPLAAAAFAPFASLPSPWGDILWRLGTMVPYVLTVAASLRKLFPQDASARGVGLLLLLALSVGNLNNGQASPLVLALLAMALHSSGRGRWNLAALLIAAATFFKLYPLAFGLLLAVLYPRELAWRLGAALGGLLLVSCVLQNPGYVLAQYRSWFACLGADRRRLADGVGHWRDAYLLLRLAKIPISIGWYAAIQTAAGGALAVFGWWAQRARQWSYDRLSFLILALGACWVVLFGPSTELATYIFLGPAFAFAGARVLSIPGRLRRAPLPAPALLLGSFAWLEMAEGLNAWVPAVRRNLALHALQPLGALAFGAGALVLLLDDGWWPQTPSGNSFNPEPLPSC